MADRGVHRAVGTTSAPLLKTIPTRRPRSSFLSWSILSARTAISFSASRCLGTESRTAMRSPSWANSPTGSRSIPKQSRARVPGAVFGEGPSTEAKEIPLLPAIEDSSSTTQTYDSPRRARSSTPSLWAGRPTERSWSSRLRRTLQTILAKFERSSCSVRNPS